MFISRSDNLVFYCSDSLYTYSPSIINELYSDLLCSLFFEFYYIFMQTNHNISKKKHTLLFFFSLSVSLSFIWLHLFLSICNEAHSCKINNNNDDNWFFKSNAMITVTIHDDDVNENEYIELTHYLSYMIVYYVLQVSCLITVCIQ